MAKKKRTSITRILALDLAKATGWANNYGHGGTKLFEVKCFGKRAVDSPGKFWSLFDCWLRDQIKRYPPQLIVFEASLHQPGYAARVANGLVATLELVAHNAGIPTVGVSSSAIKKHATGSGNQRTTHRKADTKQLMLKAAKKKWKLSSEDNNYIDALWILDYAKTHLI